MGRLGNNGASNTPHPGWEPGLDPVIPTSIPETCVPGPYPTLCLVADGVRLAIQDVVDAHVGYQVDVVRVDERHVPHHMVDPKKPIIIIC